jgi:hypothetical protein
VHAQKLSNTEITESKRSLRLARAPARTNATRSGACHLDVAETAQGGHAQQRRTRKKQKRRSLEDCSALHILGWLMGLEPTTTGITILDSTN